MNNIPELLASSSLLDGVSAAAIEALGLRAELVELSVGKPFQRSGHLASGPALVVQGRLRRVHQQPGSTPLSLGSIERNNWVGWGSAVRGEPDLTLIASQVTILVLVPLGDAIAAVREHESLRQALAKPLFEETAVLLLQELERRGRSVAEPRQLLEELFDHWSLIGPADTAPAETMLLLSGPRPAAGHPLGALQNAQTRADLPLQVNGLPTRIICLPEARLADALGDFQPARSKANALALRPEQRPVLLARPGGESPEDHGFHRPQS